MQIEGFVQEIKTKDTKVGPMYDLKVNGDYYGHGKFAPRDIKEGDYVEFVMEQNGNFRNIGRGTLRKKAAPPKEEQERIQAPIREKLGPSDDAKQATIAKQSALNSAIALIDIAVKAGALALPEAKGKGYAILEQAVFEQAARFHLFSVGTPVEIPDAEGKAKAAKPKANTPTAPVDAEWQDDPLPETL